MEVLQKYMSDLIADAKFENEDQVREFLRTINLEPLLKGMKNQDDSLIQLKVLIVDNLESDFYVASNRALSTLFPFSRSWGAPDVNEDDVVFADRFNSIGRTANEELVLHFYQSEQPPIFSEQRIVGIMEQGEVHVLCILKEVEQVGQYEGVYGMLKQRIMSLIGDDQICVEWVLMVLLSGICYREGEDLGGRIILNIIGSNSQLAQNLCHLTQPSRYVPLTLHSLNKERMIPQRNLNTYRIEGGFLTLPVNVPSLYVVDECCLEQGALDEVGYGNLQHLKNCIEESVLKIDFNYSQTVLPTQYRSIVCSQGKSMIPSDVIITYRGVPSTTNVDISEIYPILRDLCARQLKVTIPEPLRHQISSTYIERRVQDSTINPKVLSTWVALMKIYCALDNCLEAASKHFDQAITLWKTIQ